MNRDLLSFGRLGVYVRVFRATSRFRVHLLFGSIPCCLLARSKSQVKSLDRE